MGNQLPTPAKIFVVVAGLVLLRLVVVGVLPGMGLEGFAWPLHLLFLVWVVALWTGGGRYRQDASAPRQSAVSPEVEERTPVQDYGYDLPRPHGLSPRWVPSENCKGGYLTRFECLEQFELEIIVRKSWRTNATDDDLSTLEPLLLNKVMPSNPSRGRVLVAMEIEQQESELRSERSALALIGNEWTPADHARHESKRLRLNALIKELKEFLARIEAASQALDSAEPDN